MNLKYNIPCLLYNHLLHILCDTIHNGSNYLGFVNLEMIINAFLSIHTFETQCLSEIVRNCKPTRNGNDHEYNQEDHACVMEANKRYYFDV